MAVDVLASLASMAFHVGQQGYHGSSCVGQQNYHGSLCVGQQGYHGSSCVGQQD